MSTRTKAVREGKNKIQVENLSYLNPNGKAIDALKSLDKNTDVDTQQRINKIADWIGEARKRNQNLTDAHENEMFDFLMDKDSSNRFTTKNDFLSKVNSLSGGFDFNPEKPLNIASYKYKTEGEKQYDEAVEKQKKKIIGIQDNINDINARIADPNHPKYLHPDSPDYKEVKQRADNKLAELNNQLKNESKNLLDLYRQKGKFTSSGKEQGNLFEPKLSYGSEHEYQDAITQATRRTNDVGFGRLLDISGRLRGRLSELWKRLLNKRTVRKDFAEAGKLDVTGTQITTPADLVDLFLIQRSPLIEKAHIIFIKDGRAIANHAHTLGRADMSSFGIRGTIIEMAKSYGADEVQILHNHPSGNHEVSQQDINTTKNISDALFENGIKMGGHMVIDTDKFSFIDDMGNVTEHDYKNKPEPLFTTALVRVDTNQGGKISERFIIERT